MSYNCFQCLIDLDRPFHFVFCDCGGCRSRIPISRQQHRRLFTWLNDFISITRKMKLSLPANIVMLVCLCIRPTFSHRWYGSACGVRIVCERTWRIFCSKWNRKLNRQNMWNSHFGRFVLREHTHKIWNKVSTWISSFSQSQLPLSMTITIIVDDSNTPSYEIEIFVLKFM